jgi:hypothetical protein
MGEDAKSSFERSLTEARSDDVRGDFATPTGRGGIYVAAHTPASTDRIPRRQDILSENRRILDQKKHERSPVFCLLQTRLSVHELYCSTVGNDASFKAFRKQPTYSLTPALGVIER